MNRRSFVGAVMATVAGWFGLSRPRQEPELAVVERHDGKRWVRCRMRELKPGDWCTVDGGRAYLVMGKPYIGKDGVWGVKARTFTPLDTVPA